MLIAEFESLMSEVMSGSEEAIWRLAEVYTPYIIRTVQLSQSSRLRANLTRKTWLKRFGHRFC